MKYLFSLATFIFIFQSSIFAQGAKQETATFQVSGNCGMCKQRIENAARLKGVINANWNVETEQITVQYNPQKVSIDAVQQNIAKVGHDTEKYKADEKAYKNLHGCCKYKSE